MTFSPYEELILHEIVELDERVLLEEMVRQALTSPVHAEPTVNWIDEVAFVYSPLPPTEDVIKEGLNGRVHYASVMFAKMPYQAQIPVKLGNQEYSVRLRKADRNPTLMALGKFLKDFHPKVTE